MQSKSSKTLSPYSPTELIKVQSGYVINPKDEQWILDKDITLNLDFVNRIEPKSAAFVRNTLAERAKKYMAMTLKGECSALKDLFRGTDNLSCKSFFSWLPVARSPSYPVILKSFILYGYEIGIKGGCTDLVETLAEHSFSAGRDVTLKPVESHDLVEGPFSDLELGNIMAKSLRCYTAGKMPLMQYAALIFFAQTGRRGIQASDLKIKDLQESIGKSDIPTYYVNVPRRKQRGQKFRETFNKTVIDEDLWIVLALQADRVKQTVLHNIKDVDDKVLDDLPLFPSSNLDEIDDLQILISKVRGDFLHIKAAYISDLVSKTTVILNITSERTGTLLKITPKRFRHTIGTNSAREGYGARIIAEILDHTTDVVAGIYTKNTPDIVNRLDRALATQLAPLAQTFAGVIIDSEREAIRANDPASRITNGGSNLGSCGSFGFCSASAPIACYTCSHFQPWRNAPHEEVLSHLVDERERLSNLTGDLRIAAVNDRLILAVTEVIQLCEKHKLDEGASNSV